MQIWRDQTHMVWKATYDGSYPRYGLVNSKHTRNCRKSVDLKSNYEKGKHDLAMYEKDVGEMYRDDTI